MFKYADEEFTYTPEKYGGPVMVLLSSKEAWCAFLQFTLRLHGFLAFIQEV